jgi:hypothetical protein
MKSPSRLLGVALLFLVLDYPITRAEDLTQEQQLKAGFDLSKIKALWSELTLHQGESFGDHMVVIANDDLGYQERTFQVTDKKHCQMTFLQKDKTLVGFMDDGIFDRLYNPPHAPLYDIQDQPKWTADQAIAKGEKVLSALVDRTRFHFAHPSAKYIHTQNGGKYYVGQWEINWRRTDSKGHLFDALQGVDVYVAESEGPFQGGADLSAKYVEPSGEPLKAADVQDKAWKAAQAAVVWGPVKSVLEPEAHLEPKPFSAKLQIVMPNHMGQGDAISTHPDLNARLAWVFWYEWKFDNNPKQRQSVGVWIDAYTGKVLGGDVGM